ncbi:MAG TPA: pinensin family lanthipeptide [Longimicrobiaceae bacterium]
MRTKRGKLRLELDNLRVESFATQEGDESSRGTIRGHVSWLCPDTTTPSDTDCTDCFATEIPCPTGATVCYVCTDTNTQRPGCMVV